MMAPASAEAGASGRTRGFGASGPLGPRHPRVDALRQRPQRGCLEGAPAGCPRPGPSSCGWDATRYLNGIG